MPKLKTYLTSIGFFEMAIAAPSMKAAITAWDASPSVFSRGFAKETTDAAIVAATLEHPNKVLCRAVGSKGPFTLHARLPELSSLPSRSGQRPSAHQRGKAQTPATAKILKDRPLVKAKKSLRGERAAERREAKAQQRQEARAAAESHQEALKAKRRAVKLSAEEAKHKRIIDRLDRHQRAIDVQRDKEQRRFDHVRERLRRHT